MDNRYDEMMIWLQSIKPQQGLRLQAIAGGASFRRYFRLFCGDHSWVVMDSPPDCEPLQPYIAVTNTFAKLGLRVPSIYAQSSPQGFLLLEDFGDDLFFKVLDKHNVDGLYRKAMQAILHIQCCKVIDGWKMPHLDEAFLLTEMQCFSEWYLQKHCGCEISTEQHKMLDATFANIAKIVAAQAQVCIHRDFHTQNLMRLADGEVGIIDFQSAMIGPITYDFVSLVKDCYCVWPSSQVFAWIEEFHQMLLANNPALVPQSLTDFKKDVEMTGLQRHLKAILTYARKKHRDNDDSYLQFIPSALKYIQDVTSRYVELAPFHALMQDNVLIKEDF